MAAPSHSLLQPDCGDDGGDEGDGWTSHGQAKSVEDTIQSVQPFLVPEMVSSDVDLPGSPPGGHLVEARDAVLGRDDETQQHQNRQADPDDDGQNLRRHAPLSSQREQNTHAPLRWNDGREQNRPVAEPVESDDVVVHHVPVNRTVLPAVGELRVDALGVEDEEQSEVDEVEEGEREEAEVDSFFEALLEEHHHVDDVGRGSEEVEDGNEDGGFESVSEVLNLLAYQVPGVVPRDAGVDA